MNIRQTLDNLKKPFEKDTTSLNNSLKKGFESESKPVKKDRDPFKKAFEKG